MALSAKLQLRQSQSLVMTPQLMQSIKLLQFTHLELDRYVEEEIERNPLLERLRTEEDTFGEGEAAPDDVRTGDGDDLWTSEPVSDILDTSMDNVCPDETPEPALVGPELLGQWKSAGGGQGADFDGLDFQDLAARRPTLRDHVAEQIAFEGFDPVRGVVARELAEALDESGYFRGDIAETAARLGVGEDLVQVVLAACQRFDPPGLFARDLAECLALQLQRRDRLDPAMRTLVDNLALLARRDFQALRRLCGVDDEDLMEMFAEIRALDPRPGLAFSEGPADPVVADVEVRANASGGWSVELNPDTLPRVLVDQVYFQRVSRTVRDTAEKEFLADCLQTANWLTRSLDQRARTILKVASEIVRQQDAFLVHGVQHLRPLNLRTVADAIGMHESTVSRVTSNKYILTPRGVFELKYFFTASIASVSGGDAHSSEAVRDRIRRMIDQERPKDVLSDDAIVDILKKDGVDIARRTVAKYREGMNIPSSVQRRREKRALEGVGA
jgi:RNA polymerase sigma-54 factor